jgi:YidC/Oxa1 family membrane protein insertase
VDRNVVIATVLIAVIMFVWLWWIAPPPPDPAAPGAFPADTQDVAAQPVPLQEPEPEAPSVRPAPTDSIFAAVEQGTARVITVENDLYRAQLSSKGATLVSFVLKEYDRADQQAPVQLVDTTTAGALALLFQTPTSHDVDTRSLYFEPGTDRDTLRVAEAPVTLSFEAQIGAGVIRQTYTFKPETYEVELRVEQENASVFTTDRGYDLLWDGSIPYTEDNLEDEARHAGAFARSGGEVEKVTLDSDAYEERPLSGEVDWVAVKNKYFTAVVMPQGQTRGAELIGEQVEGTFGEDYAVSLQMPPPAGEADLYLLYIGPMEFFRITDYHLGLYDMVDYGWDAFEWMTRTLAKFIFIPAFNFLSQVIPNYGIVIILLAIFIKLLLYPLTKSSYKSMARMRELQPKMEAIKEQYADNPQKQQEAMMKMYRETGVNPLGGCLPMLLQYPIIIALWQFLPQSIELRQQGFLWAHDLSAPDVILNLPFTIPVYGDFVAGFTLMMGLSMIVQMKIQMAPSSNPQAKIFTYVFPVMIFAIFNRLASGLSLYYLCYNIFTAVQQKFINKSMEEQAEDPSANGKGGRKDARRAVKEASGKKGGRGGGRSSKRVRT